jgi:hypothetical protein
MKRKFASITAAGIWITVSEFVRNEFLFKSYWVDHFRSLGLEFETKPVNGILWLVWSFALAYVLFRLMEKFSFTQAIFLAWLSAFFMMWITVYNLQTLPLGLLIFAVPLSLLEIFVAAYIHQKFSKSNRSEI